MPAINDLCCLGQAAADGLSGGRRAVPAYDLDARMSTQSRLQGVGRAVGNTSIRSWVSASITTVA